MGKVMIITGATGFVGRRIVLHALQRSHQVIAVVRPGRDIADMPWSKLENISTAEVDLAARSSVARLQELLLGYASDSTVVIHAAGSMTGDDETQHAQTVLPTEYLMRAMLLSGHRRVVLLSSMSIYGYAAMPENSQLDETTPTEPNLDQRDAYCRAKLQQEMMLLEAAQLHGFVVTALRPGAIFGYGHLLTSRLGSIKSTFGIRLGNHACLPLNYVEHCAEAAILSAEQNTIPSDVYVKNDESGKHGAFEAINVLDDILPTQYEYIQMLKKHTSVWPAFTLFIPWSVMKLTATLAASVAMVWPGLLLKLPGLFKEASLHARIKPLKFSNARLHDRLGWRSSMDWKDVILQSDRNDP